MLTWSRRSTASRARPATPGTSCSSTPTWRCCEFASPGATRGRAARRDRPDRVPRPQGSADRLRDGDAGGALRGPGPRESLRERPRRRRPAPREHGGIEAGDRPRPPRGGTPHPDAGSAGAAVRLRQGRGRRGSRGAASRGGETEGRGGPVLRAADGVLVVDKPEGPTSHDVVDRVRRALGLRRVGHTGTLDPFATGVLPVCTGKATRLASILSAGVKAYEARIRLGFATSTDDRTGRPLGPPQPVAVTHDAADAVCRRFVGEIEQIPPAYSAKRVAGERLYELARRG